MNKNTNSRDFRTNLSEYFDKAVHSPISISRGKDHFILMNEQAYLKMQDELLMLQRNLISILEQRALENETKVSPQEDIADIFDKITSKTRRANRKKKRTG